MDIIKYFEGLASIDNNFRHPKTTSSGFYQQLSSFGIADGDAFALSGSDAFKIHKSVIRLYQDYGLQPGSYQRSLLDYIDKVQLATISFYEGLYIDLADVFTVEFNSGETAKTVASTREFLEFLTWVERTSMLHPDRLKRHFEDNDPSMLGESRFYEFMAKLPGSLCGNIVWFYQDAMTFYKSEFLQYITFQWDRYKE